MKYSILAVALLAAGPLAAQEERPWFGDDSEARSWNLYAEEPARFTGTVVDLTCEITGDCPANCGDGNRQLGILRDADGVLVNVQKNAQTSFNGGVADMLPWCGQSVEVDGLILWDEDLGADNIYLVQQIRAAGSTGDWTPANTWVAAWEARNPEALDGGGPWFRRDPRVLADIAQDGYFGLGLDRDPGIIAQVYE